MNRICRFTVPASRDIESIMDYIADRSGFDAAESFLDRINDKCQTLSQFPSMGRNRDELMENVRSLWKMYGVFRSTITSFSTVRLKQELKFCGLLAATEI